MDQKRENLMQDKESNTVSINNQYFQSPANMVLDLNFTSDLRTTCGRDIEVSYDSVVRGNCNRGWIEDCITMYISNNMVAYLLVSYMEKSSYDIHNPTIFNFISNYDGWAGFPTLLNPIEGLTYHDFDTKQLDIMMKSILWKEFNEDYSRQLSRKELLNLASSTEKRLNKKYKARVNKFKKTHIDLAIVDFIHTKSTVDPLNFSVGLSVLAAQWFNNRNIPIKMLSLFYETDHMRPIIDELKKIDVLKYDSSNKELRIPKGLFDE